MEVEVSLFTGGQISLFFHKWETLTSDPHILQIVLGDSIQFDEPPPSKHYAQNSSFTPSETEAISTELENLLKKRVIKPAIHQPLEYVSPIFVTPKFDGGYRLILNLKDLNTFVHYEHFKMDSIKTVLNLVTLLCYMCKVDLKDAYYSVKMTESSQRFLKFVWLGTLYQYVCFPNGLACCPRQFTKLMKIPLSTLRLRGISVSGYIDDFINLAQDFLHCQTEVSVMLNLFQELGFVINFKKSVLLPQQELEFLGFLINSKAMTVELTKKKKTALLKLINQLLTIKKPTIRFLAKVLGTIVASFPGSKYGPLYYRHLDHDKTAALRTSRGDFEATLHLSPESVQELTWWRLHIDTMRKWIYPPRIAHILHCDASDYAWGATLTQKTGGAWNPTEKLLHINLKEMLAIYYALRAFLQIIHTAHVKVFSDNMTAVTVLNKMGTSKSPPCNALAKTIWEFCIVHNIWLTCAHVPGIYNVEADTESRKAYKDSEWMLDPHIFSLAMTHCGFSPKIDCFATRINTQLCQYISYKPDPFSTYVDAFSVDWQNLHGYLFPPFSLIGRTLQKVQMDHAVVVLVVPYWPTQPWFNTFQRLLMGPAFMVKPHATNLILVHKPQERHPLWRKLRLMIGKLSGKNL